ncbi:MAG: biotin/lipoate A/B protein ligase family protein [Candidatus Methylomirabilales bacterium]
MSEVSRIPRVQNQHGRWRFLLDEARDGPTNMAIDEVLALCCERGWSPPSLRLYRWITPTVSVGYNQPIHGEVDLTTCRQRGVPLVRRPTGGRALLHHQELTYSLALPIQKGSRGVLQDYRWISHCLILGLQMLGVAATMSRGDRSREASGELCFLTPSRYELTVNGRKLMGSAQRRFNRALLQQGSLLVQIDLAAWMALFPQGRELKERVTTLERLLGRSPSWEQMVEAIGGGFEEGAGVQLKVGGLTVREWALAQVLVVQRYGSPEWTFRR